MVGRRRPRPFETGPRADELAGNAAADALTNEQEEDEAAFVPFRRSPHPLDQRREELLLLRGGGHAVEPLPLVDHRRDDVPMLEPVQGSVALDELAGLSVVRLEFSLLSQRPRPPRPPRG